MRVLVFVAVEHVQHVQCLELPVDCCPRLVQALAYLAGRRVGIGGNV